MTRNFWTYVVVKTARKSFWLPYARWRNRGHGGHALRAGRTAYGVDMLQRWNDRTFVYCHAGIYGRFLSDYLNARRQPFDFVDIGANQGLYSLIAARNPACRRVVAFEPVTATHRLLHENASLNGLADKIAAHRLGISDSAGLVEIQVPDGHSGMATIAANGGVKPSAQTESIATIGAQELGQHLSDDLSLVVKVDVEGHEQTVIRQLLACVAADRVTAIFYEIDTRWSDAEEIAALLRAAGFSRFRKVGFGHHFDVLAER